MRELLFSIIYQPLYNLLIWFYNIFPWQDFGIAIVLATLFLKFLMAPLSRKQVESQKKLAELQPKIKALQSQYKEKQEQAMKLMQLYKAEGVNPVAGCLPLLFQLVILIAIYQVIINITGNGLVVRGEDLYSFVHNPGQVKHLFLNIIDLGKPNIALGVLAAVAQYWQTKMLMPPPSAKTDDASPPDMAQMMTKQMLYIGPVLTIWIGATFPAGLALYWLVSTLFAVAQQTWIMKRAKA